MAYEFGPLSSFPFCTSTFARKRYFTTLLSLVRPSELPVPETYGNRRQEEYGVVHRLRDWKTLVTLSPEDCTSCEFRASD
jgi:hypothetical protein